MEDFENEDDENKVEDLDSSQNITPRLHILSAHFCDFGERRGWVSAVSKQGIEHLHHRFNLLNLRFRNAGTPEAEAERIIKYHTIANFLHDIGMDPLENYEENEE